MKRSTVEERRWDTTKRNGSVATPPPLVATAALQAYLSNDVDAKSRIPRSLPAAEPVGKEALRSIAPSKRRQARDASCIHTKPSTPTQLRIPVDATTANVADSPLSRFQKHMKQTQLAPDRRNSLQVSVKIPQTEHLHYFQRRDTVATVRAPAAGSPQDLTRSLLAKIQESKRLLQTEAATGSRNQVKQRCDPGVQRCLQSALEHQIPGGVLTNSICLLNRDLNALSPPAQENLDAAQSIATNSVLKTFPPIPHAKPVIPVIPLVPTSPSSKKLTAENQHADHVIEKTAKKRAPKEATPSICDVILTTNAVLSIQRMWRRKRLSVRSRKNKREFIDGTVTLIIDKCCDGVVPLYSAAKARNHQVTAQHIDEAADECIVINDVRDMEPLHVSGHPWADHELVFLEEGRCIGELQEAVCRGVPADKDELLWKRPQQIIQQLETQRVATTQKTRRKRAPSRQYHFLPKPSASHVPNSLFVDANASFPTTLTSTHCILPPFEHAPLPYEETTTLVGEEGIRRKLKLPRVHLKHRKIATKRVFSAAGRSTVSRMRRLLVRVKGFHPENSDVVVEGTAGKEEARSWQLLDEPNIAEVHCSISSVQQSGTGMTENPTDETLHRDKDLEGGTISDMLACFVVFEDSEDTTNDKDTQRSRNDLINMGDLALARSLLDDERHSHTTVDLAEHYIPLKLSPSSPPAPQPRTKTQILLDKPASTCDQDLVTTARSSRSHRHGDEYGDQPGSCTDDDNNGDASTGEEPEDMAHHEYPWTWEELLAWVNSSGGSNSLLGPFTSARSSEDNASTESCIEDESTAPQQCSHPTAGPVQTLKVVRSAVTETMGRIHTKYRDEEATSSEQPEVLLSSPPPASADSVAQTRLNEDKRIEFLRVLDEFKRCLQGPSPDGNQAETRQRHLNCN